MSPRDQGLACLGGVLADLDGAGAIVDLLQGSRPGDEAPWFEAWHHLVGHNLTAGLLIAAALALPARARLRTFAWALLAFHLHLLCDLVGSRGPEGEIWSIPYLLPFSDRLNLAWAGQWELNAWPNLLITLLGLAWLLRCARDRGHSPLGLLSAAADAALVETLRRRFPPAPGTAAPLPPPQEPPAPPARA